MLTYDDQMKGLNDEQREAAQIGFNAVVAAGAGSGKTKVLASRFLHLIVQEGIPVERILALTFTRKAAAEMRGRIYSTLINTESEEARKAASAFYSAQIQTLDSFCATICRATCREYGISPDFAVDNEGIAERMEQAALSFILQHRASPALSSLMKKFTLEDIAERLFVAAMREHSSLSSPLNFEKIAAEQKKAVRKKFDATVSSIIMLFNELKEMSLDPCNKGKTWDKLSEALKADFTAPDITDRKAVARFVKACAGVASTPKRVVKEMLTDFGAQTYTLASLANFILNEAIIDEAFALLREAQDVFNGIKRASNALTFRDISQMALDALKDDSALRRFWKGQFDSIMIDEFQDNNELQKNLLYLLAGDCEAGSVPKPESLDKNKLFFVGDEKQSIYRFRGADVSVFRRLSTELGQSKKMPQLRVNYRTERRLIEVFNSIFPHVFRPASAEGFADYEAEFFSSDAHVETEGCDAGLEVILFAEKRFDSENKELEGKTDSEAKEVAKTIKRLFLEEYKIRDKGGAARPCGYGDIAILFRSKGKQRRFEQALRDEDIPFTSESLDGLFTDAPANDFYSLLRLACNPEDAFSYAVVLRSPFAAVDDESFARIMAARVVDDDEQSGKRALPFSESDAALVAECSREKFARAAEIFAFVQKSADRLPIARIVSALWYDFGYRYAVISDPALARYREIYDYFFELARQADAKASSLSDFLDSIEKRRKAGEGFSKKRKERFDEVDMPSDSGDAVRLMTVHKSKGLEFPIVFVVDAGSRGAADTNGEPFYFSDKYSITINTEAPEELKGVKIGDKTCDGNFFFMEAKAENDAKAAAEIKRLLYVAMTRAEAKVFVSGIVNLKPKDGEFPKGALSEDELREIIAESAEKGSFLSLLLPAIAQEGVIEGVSIREALPKRVQKRKRDAKVAPVNLIEGVECVDYKAAERAHYAASELYAAKRALEGNAQDASADELSAKSASDAADDELDALLKKHGVSHADFGTHVHAAIEERFTGHPARIPQEIRDAAFKMADSFFASEIGKSAKSAAWRQAEYGFAIKTDVEGLGPCVVKGKMDLVFEDGGTLFVVDYKTDKEENPAIYIDQMETYKKAAKGLFADKFPDAEVEGVLFYLRQGIQVRV